MSEESRRALKEAFDQDIKRYLESEEYKAKKPTFEEFKAMVEAEKERRKLKNRIKRLFKKEE